MNKIKVRNGKLYLRNPTTHVCFRTVIEGIIDNDKIENAVEKVCIRHPFFNCFAEIDNHEDDSAWLVQRNISIKIEYFKSNETDWQSLYRKADDTPFDFSQGPLVRFCVIYGTHTEIIMLGHHLVGDGISFLTITSDLLLALDNRLDETPQILPFEPENEYFKQKFDNDIKEAERSLWETWKKSSIRLSKEKFLEFSQEYRRKFVPNLHMASMEGDNLKKLLEKSKSNNITVNNIIISAFIFAVMELLNKKEINFGMAVNFRNEMSPDPKNCIGNFYGIVVATAYNNPEKDFIHNALEIAQAANKQLANFKHYDWIRVLNDVDRGSYRAIMLALYGTLEPSAPKELAEAFAEQLKNPFIGISNLGRHDLDNYNTFKIIDVQFIGPTTPEMLIKVDVITVNNKLNLCLRYKEREIDTDTVKKICKKALELLQ